MMRNPPHPPRSYKPGEEQMSKRKEDLTEEQRRRNTLILARLEAERQRLIEETRALQRQYRREIRREQSQKQS